MGQSYRIRTTPGDDKNIVIQVNQNFEQLEILSLKVRQQDVYTRMCSDYGVVAGRIFTNKGYGIPNAKVSIFIPLLTEDENNPVITSLYPYKNLEQTNEDGYRYNLLPYYPSYPDHIPTGTFPSRIDALTNQTVVELYDKYYKFTVTTNDAGDFLIFGVPTGTQTITMNVDLSDIGEFSLSPQDLIRMGLATESQFDGVKFKSSPNFETLPQIIVSNKTIEVVPFWGEEDICRIGISRVDFDLTAEANLNIQPVSIFMGSLMSSNEKTGIKANGRAKQRTGLLCGMFAGPGEILAISQTLFRDNDGLPILKKGELPNAGKLIDADGTWLFDLPMNLNYVYTNEFGCKVFSEDPKIGIPTKAKYRFKIKWQQSKNLNEDYKRAYYLVPNIKERGWSSLNPKTDPLSGSLGVVPYKEAQSSYAFSLSWSAYTTGAVSVNNPDILSIINCEDYFYEFDYNKVYTISQLLDQDKIRKNRKRFLGIKRINDDDCENTANKYPVNDGYFNPTLIMTIFIILITIVGMIMLPLLILYHFVAFILNTIYGAIISALCGLCGIKIPVIKVKPFGWLCKKIDCNDTKVLDVLRFPMLNYPDCEVCNCSGDSDPDSATNQFSEATTPYGATSIEAQEEFYPFYFQSPQGSVAYTVDDNNIRDIFSDFDSQDTIPVLNLLQGKSNIYTLGSSTWRTNDLNFGERINAFNTKGKYYNDNGGNTQISVQYEPTISTNTLSHFDNVIVFIVTYGPGTETQYSAGTVFTFVQPEKSTDPNITGNTKNLVRTYATTGATNFPTTINIEYADPSNRIANSNVTYSLPQVPNPFTAATFNSSASTYFDFGTYGYPSDIEYFQVVKSYITSDFLTSSKLYPRSGSFADIIEGKFYIYKEDNILSPLLGNRLITSNMVDTFSTSETMVVIAQRGVDPYSPMYQTKVGLGRLLGYDNHNDVVETIPLRLNIPVKNTTNPGNQMMYVMGNSNNITPNNGLNLFYPSYVFSPSNYIPYNTSLPRWYSALDNTYAPFPPTTIYSSHPLRNYSTPMVYNNVLDIRTSPANNFNFFTSPSTGLYDGKIFFLNKSEIESPYYRLDINEGYNVRTFTDSPIYGYSTGATTFTVGKKYIIVQYNPGDDFSNITNTSNIQSGNINQTGCIFIATAATPSTWTFYSKVSEVYTIDSFLTPSGCPNRTLIDAGEWVLNQFATSSSGSLKLGFEIYKRDSSNNETKLQFTYNFTDIITTSKFYEIKNSCSNNITILNSDRIVIKLICYNDTLNNIHHLTLTTKYDGSTQDLPASYLLTTFIRDDAKYSNVESFAGGTYMFLSNAGLKLYYSPVYSSLNYSMNDSQRIIMRSDRLPSTDVTNLNNMGSGNSGVFQQNTAGSIYFPKMGGLISYNSDTVNEQVNSDIDTDYTGDTQGLDSNILNSFGCDGLKALDCYKNIGLSLTVDPNCKDNNRVENGCYVFVRRPIKDLGSDIKFFNEYLYRFKFYYRLCQGVIGDSFINNWINGNLYAFPFKINTLYNRFNKVKKRKYPKRLVMLQYESNNFYYRSSPYDIGVNKFIGAPGGPIKKGNVVLSSGANTRNLRYPTTILNMGPKLSFLKDITLGPEFLGYYMDKLSSTSYNDLDDMVNFFAITRMASPGLFPSIKSANSVKALFSRPGDKVDGDYAQSAAINSQFGVVPLDGDFYTSAPPNPDVICAGAGTDIAMMGIFFDSSDEDLQLRDYVSPVREIRYNPTNSVFAYDYVTIKSQLVPNYKWDIKSGGQTIFGTQLNNWATSNVDIIPFKYQSLDRLSSPYHMGHIGNPPNDYDKRGYIFGIDDDPTVQTYGTLTVGKIYVIADYEDGDDFTNVGASSNETGVQFTAIGTTPLIWNGSAIQYRGLYQTTPTSLTPNPALVGAPWYFYFGLIKGSTALNRFFDKYVGLTLDE